MGSDNAARTYLRAMAVFWLMFGIATSFFPRIMDLFLTEEGRDASTAFSDHVWLHDGLDILSMALVFAALSTMTITPKILRVAAAVALFPTAGIFYGSLTNPYWNPLILGTGTTTLGFAIVGFLMARARDAEPSGAVANA